MAPSAPALPSLTRKSLRYALGYIGLGLLEEAASEIEKIPAADRSRSEVLSARVDLHLAAKEWDAAVAVGRALARQQGKSEHGWISWAFALRELNRVAEARDVLLEAEPLHGGKCAVLHYNLACYYCLLGELPEAKRRLAKACALGPEWKKAALDDRDLEQLWPEIRKM